MARELDRLSEALADLGRSLQQDFAPVLGDGNELPLGATWDDVPMLDAIAADWATIANTTDEVSTLYRWLTTGLLGTLSPNAESPDAETVADPPPPQGPPRSTAPHAVSSTSIESHSSWHHWQNGDDRRTTDIPHWSPASPSPPIAWGDRNPQSFSESPSRQWPNRPAQLHPPDLTATAATPFPPALHNLGQPIGSDSAHFSGWVSNQSAPGQNQLGSLGDQSATTSLAPSAHPSSVEFGATKCNATWANATWANTAGTRTAIDTAQPTKIATTAAADTEANTSKARAGRGYAHAAEIGIGTFDEQALNRPGLTTPVVGGLLELAARLVDGIEAVENERASSGRAEQTIASPPMAQPDWLQASDTMAIHPAATTAHQVGGFADLVAQLTSSDPQAKPHPLTAPQSSLAPEPITLSTPLQAIKKPRVAAAFHTPDPRSPFPDPAPAIWGEAASGSKVMAALAPRLPNDWPAAPSLDSSAADWSAVRSPDEVDLDDIMAAITHTITRDYHRFYGP